MTEVRLHAEPFSDCECSIRFQAKIQGIGFRFLLRYPHQSLHLLLLFLLLHLLLSLRLILHLLLKSLPTIDLPIIPLPLLIIILPLITFLLPIPLLLPPLPLLGYPCSELPQSLFQELQQTTVQLHRLLEQLLKLNFWHLRLRLCLHLLQLPLP